jgi:hypothetical protein
LNKYERRVAFYDVSISSKSRTFDAPAVLATKRCLELIDALPQNERLKAYKDEGEIYYVQKIRWDGDYCSILINKCDKLASNPRFSDPFNNVWRTVERAANEGLDFSCHVLVKASSDPLAMGLAVIEAVNGMSAVRIQQFLNGLLRLAKTKFPEAFRFNHPGGAVDARGVPETYNATMMFSLDGHLSQSLAHDLTEGVIGGIDLITERHAERQLDQAGFVLEKKEQMEVGLSSALAKARKVPVLRAFLNSRSDVFEKARIRFTTDAGDPRTVIVRSEDFSIGLDMAYVKRELLSNFDQPLEQSYTELNEEMIQKMTDLID